MKLNVLASGSSGNAYVLDGYGESLLIEAGLPISKLKQLMNYRTVKHVLISHEHGDHSKSALDLLKMGSKVYMSQGTADALGAKRATVVKHNDQFETEEFDIVAFDTQHDCSEPLGFLIRNKIDGNTLLFATDTYYLKYKFDGLDHIMIEANYSEEIIAESSRPEFVKNRVRKSHFELGNVVQYISRIDNSNLKNIILLHLSSGHADPVAFKETVYNTFHIPTHIAEPGLTVDL